MEVLDRPAVDVPDLRDFFRLAEQIFQFRRKQLGATVKRIAGPAVAAGLAAAGIDPQRRPQTLSLGEWQTLYKLIRE
jgi:16S rRNA A1518/A1519 N6-dimethyltransferase RsmA/KsgA/DIM1 with predicted DNA glycosylase/AP lyase activity